MSEEATPQMQPEQPSKLEILKSKRALYSLGAMIAVLVIAVLITMIGKPSTDTDVVEDAEGSDDAVTIEITPEGFEPEAIQIDAGTTVMWTNVDSVEHGLQANPYPEGTDLPELNTDEPIAPGESYSFTFDETGDFGYHDKDDPTDNGEVIVQ